MVAYLRAAVERAMKLQRVRLGVNRFFALDHQTYEPGPLGTKTKEFLGLAASTVLRCDD